jgi:hypothetical protein
MESTDDGQAWSQDEGEECDSPENKLCAAHCAALSAHSDGLSAGLQRHADECKEDITLHAATTHTPPLIRIATPPQVVARYVDPTSGIVL